MMKDLIILVADKDTKFTIDGLLLRHYSLDIKHIEYNIYIHHLHDPGIFRGASEFLRPFINQYRHALVFLDREGSGQENKTVSQIQQEIKKRLTVNGWEGRAEVIVIDPELERWVWTDSPHVAEALGWDDYQQLRDLLMKKGLWKTNKPKPERPKEAFDYALRVQRIPHSSSIYKGIADSVCFEGCVDKSFKKFRETLKNWFKEEGKTAVPQALTKTP